MEKSIIWCIISGEIFSGFPYFCTIREVEGLGMRLQIELDWKVRAFNSYLQDKMYSLTLGHGTHIHKVQFFSDRNIVMEVAGTLEASIRLQSIYL